MLPRWLVDCVWFCCVLQCVWFCCVLQLWATTARVVVVFAQLFFCHTSFKTHMTATCSTTHWRLHAILHLIKACGCHSLASKWSVRLIRPDRIRLTQRHAWCTGNACPKKSRRQSMSVLERRIARDGIPVYCNGCCDLLICNLQFVSILAKVQRPQALRQTLRAFKMRTCHCVV